MKFTVTLIFSFFTLFSSAQWSTLSTPATGNLNDVDFINEDYGVIVGNAGTILLTSDGGLNWTDISSNISAYDIHGVKVFNEDTIAVSTYDFNNADGFIFLTTNAGTSWLQIGDDSGINHKIDLESNAPYKLWSLGDNLVVTSDYGTTWDTLLNNTAGTSSLDVLAFADSTTGHISGLVSGFTTYSAIFSRTEDGGLSWYPGDVFSFPNSDAFTAMCFTDPDTAMYFMNQYAGWMPSSMNKLIKIFGFNKVSAFPGDTSFAFSYQSINTSMPAYINDAYFINSLTGYALGDDGNVYITDNGGAAWTIDYSTGLSLKKIEVILNSGDTTAYAVGNNGIAIKYGNVTGIEKRDDFQFTVFPNPASTVLNIETGKPEIFYARVYSAEGKLISEFSFEGHYEFPCDQLTSGIYTLELQNGKEIRHYSKLMKL